ncbi:MAG: hypothetical protein EOP11_10035 [Proteobacteria bacterium]|nr:MAG: hypothetical protein EOP11_10035 [Pseudomonadota bacterium]
MLKVDIQQSAAGKIAVFHGQIDETTNFASLIGPVAGSLRVNTKDVTRINSVGAKGWMQFFQPLRASGIKVTFEGCSPAIVEQINLVAPFLCGADLDSIYLPFFCESCSTEFSSLATIPLLKASHNDVPCPNCPKCGQRMIFDDIPEEYFAFLKRI